MPSKRRPLRPAGAARLDDVFLQARGIDPDAEAGEVPVPEYGVAMLDGQRVDGAFGDNPFLASRHGVPAFPLSSFCRPDDP